MNMRVLGNRFGGIKTVDDVRLRCVEDGGCWIWQGKFSRGTRGAARWATPMGWYPALQKQMPVRRIIALMAGATPEKVWRTCESAQCVSPYHLKWGTAAECGQWLSEAGRFDTRVRKESASRAWKRRHTLTDADVSVIRASSEANKDIAARFGVHKEVVARIRRGETRVPHAASVFGWRP